MQATNNRAAYIRAHYALSQSGAQWVAASGTDTISGADRADVCRLARCRWGHFNFRDEARAFNEIFG